MGHTAVAADFRASRVFLCEISYSAKLPALMKRLSAWNDHWDGLKAALFRDAHLPSHWQLRPWLFIPEESIPVFVRRYEQMEALAGTPRLPTPLVTTLEMVQPWRYRSWDRGGECNKPNSLPERMRR